MLHNKTIKDGDIAPWTIWKGLNKKKNKERTKEKNRTKKSNKPIFWNGEDRQAFAFSFASLRAFGAQVVHMLYVLLYVHFHPL